MSKSLLVYIFIVALAFYLRVLPLFNGYLSFHYDMARDAFVAKEIYQQKDIKLMGPPTSSPGLYHGVLYYYLIAIPYFIGNGNPVYAAAFLAFINSLSVIPIMLLVKRIFKSQKWAVIGGLLFAVSFEATQYGAWLSNPSPAIFTTAMFFYSLKIWLDKNPKGLPLAVLFAVLSMQFQFFLIYLLAAIVIFAFIFKPPITRNAVLLSFFIFITISSTFIVTTLKFNYLQQVFNALFGIATNSQYNVGLEFSGFIIKYVDKFSAVFINNFFPTNILLGGILSVVCLFLARKDKFILFCLLSNFLIFPFSGSNPAFVNLYGMITPAILALLLFLRKFFSYNYFLGVLILLLIIGSNILTIYKSTTLGQSSLVIPKSMVLNNQLKLIDKTYQLAEGKPFSFNSITLPFWTNTTWAYLYSWYGKSKYGYLPTFYGKDQIGQLGDDSFEKSSFPKQKTFLIMEPGDGIPSNLYLEEIDIENYKSDLLKEIDYGAIKLQVRKLKSTNEFNQTTQE